MKMINRTPSSFIGETIGYLLVGLVLIYLAVIMAGAVYNLVRDILW